MQRRKRTNLRAAASVPAVGPSIYRGTPDASGTLRIDATVTGPITHDHDVTVASSGAVFGKIRAKAIVIAGKVNGDLYATDSIHVQATGNVLGDLHAPRIGVSSGARLRGRIVMRHRPEHTKDLDDMAVHQLLGGTHPQ